MLRRIGMRAHDYGKDTLEHLFYKMKDDGYMTTQLAFLKAIESVDSIEDAFEQHVFEQMVMAVKNSEIDISVLGAYLNYAHPDERIRLKHVELFCKHLKVSSQLNVRVVGTETGSLDSQYRSHPDNHGETAFTRLKDSIERVLKVADEVDGFVAIEAVSHHIIHTPERMYRIIKEVNHPRLKVIFDPVNMMTVDNYMDQEKIMKGMFRLLEEQILVVHAKDFIIDNHLVKVVPPGEGLLNYGVLSELVMNSNQFVDVLAENIEVSKLKEVNHFLRGHFMI